MKRKPGGLETRLARRLRENGRKKGTIKACVGWYRRYMFDTYKEFGRFVHPSELREAEFEEWLTGLACDRQVSPSTQKQAFYAICYLYNYVLKEPLVGVDALRPKGNKNVRVILDQSEIRELLNRATGIPQLVAAMIYASGFRIGEFELLRLKDFDQNFWVANPVLQDGLDGHLPAAIIEHVTQNPSPRPRWHQFLRFYACFV